MSRQFNKLHNLKFMLRHKILLSRHNLLCLILKIIATINSMLRLNDSLGVANVCCDKILFMSQQITCFKLHYCDNKHYVTTYFPLTESNKSDLCHDKENSCRDKIRSLIQNAKLPFLTN